MFLEDSRGFYEFHRMSKDNFVKLLNLVSPLIRKQDTKLRKAVSPAQRLSVTLRYLATGESRRSLEFQYRISHNLISSIIPEVCDALFAVLRGTYLKLPTTSAEWQEVASGFSNVWQFPNCIGALDGKRFLVIKPDNTGAEYFDYKSHHSVIMLALVDASYKFLYIDVGAQGRASDAGVWDKCNLKKYIEDKKLQVPSESPLPYSSTQSPFVIVGDDAFPLKTYMMKPYPGKNLTGDQRIFNYRLSRASVFPKMPSILAANWCVSNKL
ncbi:Protein ALP1-like [Chionoecetes opilio]|uniref:Protein ALP1-like n=1 Tax=Chionoecetes opilio TaxID=41210 RepID=A0A8J5CK40_CHIOP|nr:Protein ALP1-like [Chionoecetes opilio]